jgi:hypothetical protein
VSHADRAHIGEAAASPGTTVYDGDRLSTETGGTLRLKLATAVLDLAPQTTLTLHSSDSGQGAQVELVAGILVFSTLKAPGVAVCAAGAWITPGGDAPAIAHIRVVSAKELRISVERGALQFSYKGESDRIAEGQAFRVILDPDGVEPASFQSGQESKKPPARKHKAFLFILIAVAAGAAVPLLIQALESPDRP